MLGGAPIMADEDAILFVGETGDDWKEDVFVQTIWVPVRHAGLPEEGFSELEEPKFGTLHMA